MTTTFPYNQSKFSKSVNELNQLPSDEGFEVGFIGRSNAGKSSALNAITGIKNLARISKTPGRTQMINIFCMDNERRLVDLPGYGYAKVPRAIQKHWEQNVNEYLKTRRCLKGLIIAMDIRHPLKEMDQHLIEWAAGCKLPIHILLTKADKLKKNAANKTLIEVTEKLAFLGDSISLQIFSAFDQTGVEEARQCLDLWFS